MNQRRANHLDGWNLLRGDVAELYARRVFPRFGFSSSDEYSES